MIYKLVTRGCTGGLAALSINEIGSDNCQCTVQREDYIWFVCKVDGELNDCD